MSGFIGTKLTMNLGERSYDIILKNGALENLYQFARLDRRVAVVTDAGVPAEYAQRVADQCRDAKIITVPQGEASKSFKILETVLRQMLEFNMGRGDLVVAVGGGVVGDLAGFAASIYMRGIDFINCPTTTLSMISPSATREQNDRLRGASSSSPPSHHTTAQRVRRPAADLGVSAKCIPHSPNPRT